jgi:threonine dehydratase
VAAPVHTIDVAGVRRARAATADVVRHTPVLPSVTVTERVGGDVVLKAESLQRTGSFKIRGALNKLAALGEHCRRGVTAGSAGNHAWALSQAARVRDVPCEVFMPEGASIAKAEGCVALGATVHTAGTSVDDAVVAARARAEEAGMAFVHPFDDLDVIAGQGTLGLELLEDVDDLAKVVIPIGGGGLASGVAIAVKSARPEVEVVGVEVERTKLTIADGIAVKEPGTLTTALMDRWLDDRVVVTEEEIAHAMVLLMEKAKLVVEGAGAVGVAALLAGRTEAARTGITVPILSGGNVDAGLLAEVARRNETEAGRRLVVLTRLSDRPGSLASLLTHVGETGANLIEVQHVREGVTLHVRETAVELVLETKGREHAEDVLKTLQDAGYETTVLR